MRSFSACVSSSSRVRSSDRSQLVDDHGVAGIAETHGVNEGVEKILDVVVPVQPTHEGAVVRILDGAGDAK